MFYMKNNLLYDEYIAIKYPQYSLMVTKNEYLDSSPALPPTTVLSLLISKATTTTTTEAPNSIFKVFPSLFRGGLSSLDARYWHRWVGSSKTRLCFSETSWYGIKKPRRTGIQSSGKEWRRWQDSRWPGRMFTKWEIQCHWPSKIKVKATVTTLRSKKICSIAVGFSSVFYQVYCGAGSWSVVQSERQNRAWPWQDQRKKRKTILQVFWF